LFGSTGGSNSSSKKPSITWSGPGSERQANDGSDVPAPKAADGKTVASTTALMESVAPHLRWRDEDLGLNSTQWLAAFRLFCKPSPGVPDDFLFTLFLLNRLSDL
jgi:hypothetical protein